MPRLEFERQRPRECDGRFSDWQRCDGCGKPVKPGEHYTDDEVCGSTDGPGFFLCARKRCAQHRNALDVAARRELYTNQRRKNEA
jgi:hypothetical protein